MITAIVTKSVKASLSRHSCTQPSQQSLLRTGHLSLIVVLAPLNLFLLNRPILKEQGTSLCSINFSSVSNTNPQGSCSIHCFLYLYVQHKSFCISASKPIKLYFIDFQVPSTLEFTLMFYFERYFSYSLCITLPSSLHVTIFH